MGENAKRRVLVFGKTGAGKSTLANMLVYGKLPEEGCGFTMSDSMQGGTNRCEKKAGDEYEVTDTVGLAEETDSERKDAVQLIVDFLKNTRGSYHHIIFVKRKGRQDELDTFLWEIFLKVFKEVESASNGNDGYRGIVLVVTDCTRRWLEENKKDLETNYKEAKGRFIAVNFPSTGEDEGTERYLSTRRSDHLTSLKKSLDKFYHENRESGKTEFEPEYSTLPEEQLPAFAKMLWAFIQNLAKALGIGLKAITGVLFEVLAENFVEGILG